MLCVAPSTRWAPRYPRLADPETHAGLSAIHGAVCEEEVMLKCTRGMNEVDAYVEHGVHGYVPMAADDWSGARYGGRAGDPRRPNPTEALFGARVVMRWLCASRRLSAYRHVLLCR